MSLSFLEFSFLITQPVRAEDNQKFAREALPHAAYQVPLVVDKK